MREILLIQKFGKHATRPRNSMKKRKITANLRLHELMCLITRLTRGRWPAQDLHYVDQT